MNKKTDIIIIIVIVVVFPDGRLKRITTNDRNTKLRFTRVEYHKTRTGGIVPERYYVCARNSRNQDVPGTGGVEGGVYSFKSKLFG